MSLDDVSFSSLLFFDSLLLDSRSLEFSDLDSFVFSVLVFFESESVFVYAGNRGHNSITVFSVDENSGQLTFVAHTSTEGNWPRDFVLDPTEKFLVATNEKSHNLVLFSRNESTGKLTLLQSDVAVPEPVCVKFLNV
ncbi:hypothetical protein AWW69_09895 [Bacillus cereus]|nr:hypothetical protein AWW69_09895 [Bacillus cereus]